MLLEGRVASSGEELNKGSLALVYMVTSSWKKGSVNSTKAQVKNKECNYQVLGCRYFTRQVVLCAVLDSRIR